MALDNNTGRNWTDKNTIKNFFKRGLKPTQEQFWSTWDSFWHKDEKLPISSIDKLGGLLDGKAEENHEHQQYAKNDATSLTSENVISWQQALGVANIEFDDNAILITSDYARFNLRTGAAQSAFNGCVDQEFGLVLYKPTEDGTVNEFPYVVGIDTEGNSAQLPAGDLGKNFANTNLNVTTNRKHTGTASVEFGMPFICSNPSVRYSGLVNKSTDATFNRVLVTDSQGQVNYTDLLTSEFLRYENNGKVGFGLKLRRDNPNGYFPIGKDAIDLSISRSNTMYAGASGDSSVAIGNIAKASANFSIAIGENTNATQNYSVAIGYQSSANGNYSVAIGSYSTIAKGANSTAIGPASIAENTDAIAVGKQAEAKGVRSVAVGLHTNSNSEYSFSFGFSLEASTYKSFVIGFDNPTKIGQSTTAWIPTDDLFVVGNGGATIGSKSEALNIKKNGHATLPSVNDTMIDTDIKSVITKEYLDIRIPKPPTTGNFVLKSVDGLVSWVTN